MMLMSKTKKGKRRNNSNKSRRKRTIVCALCMAAWNYLVLCMQRQSIRQQLLPFLILIIIIFSACCVTFFLAYQFFRAFFSLGFGSFKSAYMHSHVENTIFGKNGIRYEWKQFMSKNNVCRFVNRCCCCCSISSAVHCNFSVLPFLPWFSWSESHLINAFDVRDVRSTIFHYTMQQESVHAICTYANPMASVFVFFFWILNSGTIGAWHSCWSKIWPTYFYFVHHRKRNERILRLIPIDSRSSKIHIDIAIVNVLNAKFMLHCVILFVITKRCSNFFLSYWKEWFQCKVCIYRCKSVCNALGFFLTFFLYRSVPVFLFIFALVRVFIFHVFLFIIFSRLAHLIHALLELAHPRWSCQFYDKDENCSETNEKEA